ncbi:hypothetical protein [Jiella marina]|uniref:hypothetical protein n=1 Tax=Jiella sp. LLJ827 TaxID=2917712 RepID=UPI0021012452|nr:hypothetical protein [Jiella sp. LLJ827]MCQ0989387.1 hypothetical protein [Jiella sp. LLJ827]
MKKFPFSLLFFVATAVIFALQAIPVTGIFLMFAGAFFWSIALVNLGFLGLTFEASVGRVSRWWLVLPALWFGGYALLYGTERIIRQDLSDEIVAHNATLDIPFDPSAESLVFLDERDLTWLVAHYDVPVAYYQAKRAVGAKHIATRRIGQSACKEIRSDETFEAAGIRVHWPYGRSRGQPLDFCILKLPEDPDLPVLEVSSQDAEDAIFTLPVKRTDATITVPDGSQYLVKDGSSRLLAVLPQPVLGCALDSSRPSWPCFAGFRRERGRSLRKNVGEGELWSAAVPSALGIPRKRMTSLAGLDATAAMQLAEQAKQRIVNVELGELDLILDDMRARIRSVPFRSLRGRIDVLRSRLDRMVSALAESVASERVREFNFDNEKTLFWLIESLPEEEIEEYADVLRKINERMDMRDRR